MVEAMSVEEQLLRQGGVASQSHSGPWEGRYGRFTPVQLRLTAQGDIEIISKPCPRYCLPFIRAPPGQIRGLDAIGASAEGRTLTIWHTLPPPKRSGSQARRRRRRLALTLQDEQGCVDAALAIRAAVSAAAPRRLLVVINPVSGRGRGQALFNKEVQPLLEAAGIQARVVCTTSKGHATELVTGQRPDQIDAIAVVGGDGTVFEVLQGMLNRPDGEAARQLPLVQIPAGSGNGLAASTGLWDVTTAVHALVKGCTSPMDVSSVLQPPARRVFSFLSLTYGMIPNLGGFVGCRAACDAGPAVARVALLEVRGQALFNKEVQPLLEAAGIQARVVCTNSKGHATELVTGQRPDQIDAIAVVGGDGTVFEVLQGMLNRPDWEAARQLPLVQIPAGSGNGLAASTGLWDVTTAVHALVKGCTSPMDVSSVLQPPARRVFSFLSLTYGMIPNLDIGTDHLRWMGSPRFVLGAIHQIMKQGAYPARVSFVDVRHGVVQGAGHVEEGTNGAGPPMRHIGAFQSLPDGSSGIASLDLPAPWQPLLAGEVQFFAACNIPWLDTNFHVAPGTLLHDGHLTLLYTLGRMGRLNGLRFMSAMDSGQHMGRLALERPIAFVLEPRASDTWIVVDGEEMAHRLTFVEVHPSLCRVIVYPRDPEAGEDVEAREDGGHSRGRASKAHRQS
ncbi:Sphingosine kinase 1 [Auxenochlorella protothecoides]|uniref:Sphingosine kinase 1 n=1 Tax=Auxenochlorella protothecoides TaxID=3075 RepID=A0A087SFL2_AUXPR|nr:Sphingosine kinase 1 [Auxenochlorella protothecoides]KFM24516.1 Sphingosine kinase 1 [Auxenochlorella protothecoides]